MLRGDAPAPAEQGNQSPSSGAECPPPLPAQLRPMSRKFIISSYVSNEIAQTSLGKTAKNQGTAFKAALQLCQPSSHISSNTANCSEILQKTALGAHSEGGQPQKSLTGFQQVSGWIHTRTSLPFLSCSSLLTHIL